MVVTQGFLGGLLLVTGVVFIVASRRLTARHRRRGTPSSPVVWVFLGTLMATNGVLQLVLAFA